MVSYEKAATKILKYLNDCYENGRYPDVEELNASKLRISPLQFYRTMQMLDDDGFVKGVRFQETIPPEQSVMNTPETWRITRLGIEYFKENSLIRKTYTTLSEARDWLQMIH